MLLLLLFAAGGMSVARALPLSSAEASYIARRQLLAMKEAEASASVNVGGGAVGEGAGLSVGGEASDDLRGVGGEGGEQGAPASGPAAGGGEVASGPAEGGGDVAGGPAAGGEVGAEVASGPAVGGGEVGGVASGPAVGGEEVGAPVSGEVGSDGGIGGGGAADPDVPTDFEFDDRIKASSKSFANARLRRAYIALQACIIWLLTNSDQISFKSMNFPSNFLSTTTPQLR